MSTEQHLAKAKEHKHRADNLRQKMDKLEPYLLSGLSFYLAGLSMERGREERSHQMYRDTQELLNFACKLKDSSSVKAELTERDRCLQLLLLRLRASLNHRMYGLKRQEASKLKRTIDQELNKLSTSKASTGTPSPLSPPVSSPAGSVCSQGSAASTGNARATGLSHWQRKYMNIMAVLTDALELWAEADRMAGQGLHDVFAKCDRVCGPLTFHSEPQAVVRYMRHCLTLLPSTLPRAPSAPASRAS